MDQAIDWIRDGRCRFAARVLALRVEPLRVSMHSHFAPYRKETL